MRLSNTRMKSEGPIPDRKQSGLYYRWFTNTPVGDTWVCVVVKYLQAEASILTAYVTDRIKSGDSYP